MEIKDILDYLNALGVKMADYLANCTEEQEMKIVLGPMAVYIVFMVYAFVKVPAVGMNSVACRANTAQKRGHVVKGKLVSVSTSRYTIQNDPYEENPRRRKSTPTTVTHWWRKYSYTVDGQEYSNVLGFGVKNPPDELTLYYMRNPKKTFYCFSSNASPLGLFLLGFGPILMGYAVFSWIEYLRTGSF